MQHSRGIVCILGETITRDINQKMHSMHCCSDITQDTILVPCKTVAHSHPTCSVSALHSGRESRDHLDQSHAFTAQQQNTVHMWHCGCGGSVRGRRAIHTSRGGPLYCGGCCITCIRGYFRGAPAGWSGPCWAGHADAVVCVCAAGVLHRRHQAVQPQGVGLPHAEGGTIRSPVRPRRGCCCRPVFRWRWRAWGYRIGAGRRFCQRGSSQVHQHD